MNDSFPMRRILTFRNLDRERCQFRPSATIYQITVTGTSPGTSADAGQSAVVALVVD
jgi:hypothetical protein